jgi:hypothetical protein
METVEHHIARIVAQKWTVQKMARLSIFEDTASQMCFKYIHNECDASTNEKMWKAIHDGVEHNEAIHFCFEIAYRIGYARSYLANTMSESTYKKKKKAIRDNVIEITNELVEG